MSSNRPDPNRQKPSQNRRFPKSDPIGQLSPGARRVVWVILLGVVWAVSHFFPSEQPTSESTSAVSGRNIQAVQLKADPQAKLVQTEFQSCPQHFPDGAPPKVIEQPRLRELCYEGFAVLHSGQTKTPVFVAQRLDRQQIEQARTIPRTDGFFEEPRLPRDDRSQLADYRRSGYSRGHMAPAGDMGTAKSKAQSFSLANIVPQDRLHNGQAWEEVESNTRKYIERAKGDVYVLTGPVFDTSPETIGSNQVAVPTYLFKVVYDAGNGHSWVHWHENRADTRTESPISYETFVERTGLRFLPESALKTVSGQSAAQ